MPDTPPPIALALSGLPDVSDATLRSVLDRARSLGVRSVSLTCNAPGLRPRELDRSARRDIVGALKRADLGCSGVDLFVPERHLTDPAHSDRAHDAYRMALDFTSEISALTGAPAVLTSTVARAAQGSLADEADRRNIRIADTLWPPIDDPAPAFGIGLDPASVLRDPEADLPSLAARHAKALLSARLSDADDAGRVPVGDGRLDAVGYLLALRVGGYDGPLIIDTRALRDAWGAVGRAIEAIRALPAPGGLA